MVAPTFFGARGDLKGIYFLHSLVQPPGASSKKVPLEMTVQEATLLGQLMVELDSTWYTDTVEDILFPALEAAQGSEPVRTPSPGSGSDWLES